MLVSLGWSHKQSVFQRKQAAYAITALPLMASSKFKPATLQIGNVSWSCKKEKKWAHNSQYLTLRSVSALNNTQNSEMNFCENMKLTCWKSS
jgi:hypothetical protein